MDKRRSGQTRNEEEPANQTTEVKKRDLFGQWNKRGEYGQHSRQKRKKHILEEQYSHNGNNWVWFVKKIQSRNIPFYCVN